MTIIESSEQTALHHSRIFWSDYVMTRFVCLEFGHTLRMYGRQRGAILHFTNLEPVGILRAGRAGLRRPIAAFNQSTTVQPLISLFRKNSRPISPVLSVVYEKVKI